MILTMIVFVLSKRHDSKRTIVVASPVAVGSLSGFAEFAFELCEERERERFANA